MTPLRVAGVVLIVVLGGCTNDRTADEQTPRPKQCSADGMNAPSEPKGLPTEVAMMRKEIIKAAVRCEYELLERLALNGGPTFNYSYGQPNEKNGAEPGRYWERQEDDGERPLATMVRLLALPFAVTTTDDDTTYVWPSATGEAPSDDDWSAVEREFGLRTVEQWRTPEGYLGPRVGITARGDWIYYVAGD